MSKIRFTLEFHRQVDERQAVRVLPRDTLLPPPMFPDNRSTMVSVLLPKEEATFEKAVEYATGLLPQGPAWASPRLVSATESAS